MRLNKKALILLCVAVSMIFSCINKRKYQDTWGVLVTGLPQKVSIDHITTIAYYIIKQTHEPLFRKDDGQNFTTRILSRWERNINYSEYKLCPNTKLLFDSKSSFSIEFFRKYIKNVTTKYDANAKITEIDKCFVVKFRKPSKRYLDFLASYKNSPCISSVSGIETGLGKFKITKLEKDRIVLNRKIPISNGFNKIIFYDYKGPKDSNLNNRLIADFNFISSEDISEWVRKEYLHFENMALKTQILILNIPDFNLRKKVYNCIDIKGFRQAIFPSRNFFYNVATVIPSGIPGAKMGLPKQVCKVKKDQKKYSKSISFCNWRNDNFNQLQEFAKDFFKKTGINIKIANYAPKEISRLIRERPRKCDLVAVMSASTNIDHYIFLSAYFGENNVLDFEVEGTEKRYYQLLRENDIVKQTEIAIEIADRIAKEYAVLPLYQNTAVFYYPKKIKNINVGKEFMEYPDIAEFRI